MRAGALRRGTARVGAVRRDRAGQCPGHSCAHGPPGRLRPARPGVVPVRGGPGTYCRRGGPARRQARLGHSGAGRAVPRRARACGPASAPEPFPAAAPAVSAAGRAVSADRAIGVGYAITEDSQHGVRGQIVIVNGSSAAVRGWRVTLVLPGDTDYQVLDAANRSAGDALVMAAPAAGQALAGGSTELIAFTARGTTSSPVRSTFTDAARLPHRGVSGAAAGPGTSQAAGGQRAPGAGHGGWFGHWLGGWLRGGWPNGGSPGGGWPGGPRAGAGQGGQQHGWPGGR